MSLVKKLSRWPVFQKLLGGSVKESRACEFPKEEPSVESQLLEGNFNEKTSLPSVALFTIHKAGSVFLSDRIAAHLQKQKWEISDISNYCRNAPSWKENPAKFENLLEEEETWRYIFSKKGIFHKAMRYPLNPDWHSNIKIIFVSRDPRDVITSWFYSIKNSHNIVYSSEEQTRKAAQNSTIDQFVTEAGRFDSLIQKLRQYQSYLSLGNRVLHESYENIVTQPHEAEERIAKFLGLPAGREKIFSASDFAVGGEDVMSHKRQVFPGDHIRKLAPETIRYCNERMRDLASVYGWKGVT